MLIAICGTQGAGKTTLLNALKNVGYNVVGKETSRTILDDWGLTLQEVYSDHKKMKTFQELLIEAKEQEEEDYLECDDIWFTDRSYVDVLAYTVMVLGYREEHSQWLSDYHARCYSGEQKYYKVMYVDRLDITLRNDGVRNTNEVYANAVKSVMLDYYIKFNKPNILTINKGSVIERVGMVEKYLKGEL